MMNWISIIDDLPNDNNLVLCCDVYNDFITFGIYIENENCFELIRVDGVEVDSEITHWMPLPELPKDE